MESSHRYLFEEWLREHHPQVPILTVSAVDDRYLSPDASRMWQAWQAARLTRHGAGDAEDSARLDWLERHVVEVREPLRYGSARMFYALQTNDEGEPYRSDLRARVDAARAGERGGVSDA